MHQHRLAGLSWSSRSLNADHISAVNGSMRRSSWSDNGTLHPDAVTLSPEAEAAAVLKRVEDGPSCSVKDSFAVLNLVPSGFHVLFEATWIRGPAAAGAGSAATRDWRGGCIADRRLSPGNARGVLYRLAGNISAVHRTSLASLKIAKGESRPPPVRCPVPLVDQPAEDRRDLAVEHVTFGLRHLVGHPHQTGARQGE
jgi:hypothetical protein